MSGGIGGMHITYAEGLITFLPVYSLYLVLVSHIIGVPQLYKLILFKLFHLSTGSTVPA